VNPDGVFFSNGPGDPEPLDYAVANVQKLQGKAPIFGICLATRFWTRAGRQDLQAEVRAPRWEHPIMNHQTGKVENYGAEP